MTVTLLVDCLIRSAWFTTRKVLGLLYLNKFILKRETIHHFDCWSNGKRVGCTRPGLHARGEGGVRKVLLRTLNPLEYEQFSVFENNIWFMTPRILQCPNMSFK